MTAEQIQWQTLDRHQAELMIGRTVAASLCVFGKAAQQAGIGMLNGSRFTLTMEDRTYDAVTWPDNTVPRTTCFAAANDLQNYTEPLTFVRITEHSSQPMYVVEGVGLNLVPGRSSAQLYGSGHRSHHSMGEDKSAAAAGLAFFSAAVRTARERAREAQYAPLRHPTATMGVRGDVIGSLLSSMITLDANLVFGLTMNEQGKLTDRTYDQAQAMLKKIISDSTSGKSSSATVLSGAGGQPYGALFAADDHGLMAIRRINTYPQTIAFTVAVPPSQDMGGTVEHYLIQPRGVYMNLGSLQPDDYSGQNLLNMLPSLDAALAEDARGRLYLDAAGLDALDLKMVKVLGGRITQVV